ncbi:hypothetical protein EII17_00545 [Clostridiales bacterium COT073_COT-073]|nr:hypothetical protein EII17_00545 [Clostridiales bacterium COT073_COT-073]
MRCKICGSEQEQGSKFCMECGAELTENNSEAVGEMADPAKTEGAQTDQQPGSESAGGLAAANPGQAAPAGQYGAPFTPATPGGYENQAGQPMGYAGQPGSGQPFMPNQAMSNQTMPAPGMVNQGMPKAKTGGKKYWLIGLPVAAVILIAVIAVFLLKGTGGQAYYQLKDNMIIREINDQVMIIPSDQPVFSLEGKFKGVEYNMERNKAAVLIAEDEFSQEYGLWYVTPKGAVKVEDDVVDMRFSDDGNVIAYLVDADAADRTATLMTYEIASKKSQKIVDEVFYNREDRMFGMALSPNGKTITYLLKNDEDKEDFKAYIKKGNKAPQEMEKNRAVLALADDAKYIYYIKYSKNGKGNLYVQAGKEDVKLIPDFLPSNLFEYRTKLTFNHDYSELLFNYEGNIYFSQKGKEKVKIAKGHAHYVLAPDGIQRKLKDGAWTSGMKTFIGQLVWIQDDVFRISDKLTAEKISSRSEQALLNRNAKILWNKDNRGKLEIISLKGKDKDKQKVAVDDVVVCVISEDGSSAYVINDENELYFVKGKDKPKRIADDVSREMVFTRSGYCFFVADGELYYSKNGGSKEKVKGISEDIEQIEWLSADCVLVKDVEGNYYRNQGNEKFEKIIVGAE